MTTRCNRWFWTDTFCCKGHDWDNGWNLNGVKGFEGYNGAVLICWFWWLYYIYAGEYPWIRGLLTKAFPGHGAWGWQLILRWLRRKLSLSVLVLLLFFKTVGMIHVRGIVDFRRGGIIHGTQVLRRKSWSKGSLRRNLKSLSCCVGKWVHQEN